MAGTMNRFALPIFMGRAHKWPAAGIMFVVGTTLYLTSNHIHLFPPQLLPMNWIDRAVPFMPNTVWIYLSEYFFFISVYALLRDMANINRYLYAFFALQITSVAIFWLWPTTYPRDAYPLPEDLNAFTYYLFSNLRQTDTPANCCPSLHVSSVYLTSFALLKEERKRFVPFFIWGTLIALSTLTTKQHYIVDVIAGLAMALLVYWVFYRIVPYRYVGAQAAGAQAKR